MENGKTRLRATAYHEAGHAAAAYFLDLPFAGVHIVRDAQRRILGGLDRETVAFDLHPKNEGAALVTLEHSIIESFAGIVAETRFTGRPVWRGGDDDLKSAFRTAVIRHPGGTLMEVGAFLTYLLVRTNEFVKQVDRWTAITALAEALLLRKRLTAVEAGEIMREAIAPPVDAAPETSSEPKTSLGKVPHVYLEDFCKEYLPLIRGRLRNYMRGKW